MTRIPFACLWLVGLSVTTAWLPSSSAADVSITQSNAAFLWQNCSECHTGETPEAGFLIPTTDLDAESDSIESLDRWIKIHDRVASGEMPPDGAPRTSAKDFLESLNNNLVSADQKWIAKHGRGVMRRMNRFEYENSIRQLLSAPWLQLKSILPEDGELYRFNKIGVALDVSHVNMARYMQAADYALRQVVARHVAKPTTEVVRYYAREQGSFNRRVHFTVFNRSPERATFPLLGYQADLDVLNNPEQPFTVGSDDLDKRELEAFGVVASSYEPIEIYFSEFRAPEPGNYKLRIKGYTFWAVGEEEKWWRPRRDLTEKGRRSEPLTIYSQIPPRQLRRLGSMDFQIEPTVQELDVWLLEGETIQPDAVRLFRSRPPGGWHNPLAEADGQPGVAFNYLEVEGPIQSQWPPAGHELLFGDLPLKEESGRVLAVSEQPLVDAKRLLTRFAENAFRRQPTIEELSTFLKVVETALSKQWNFTDSMLAGYTTILCSPGFICLDEQPGELNANELATRLGLFLWNSTSDDELTISLRGGRSDAQLREQVDRMLNDARSRQFIDTFLAYWLDLRKINDTSPDELLYPDYYLDDALVDAALEETQLFFSELISENRPVSNLVEADFTFANERLAKHYGLPPLIGAQMRKVALPASSVRGGLLTQASILKVTANGTTTSPVKRGAWVNERILGVAIPPPPKSVPAIEPDTRGASTIRQQLDLHRVDQACNICHRIIDPAGLALESFDVAGGYREFYRSLGEDGELQLGYGKNGQPFAFRRGPTVDSTGELPDGQRFSDVRELKKMLSAEARELARNLIEQLLLYSTGAPPHFSDREEINLMLDRLAPAGFPIRSIIHEVVSSKMFQCK
ncbi:MAG: DUF1592 domain-containing protein [Planctomycetales bacterium]|nr:DUF1592 domain-containing protein [Planctomycetales bacterium]